MKIICLAPRKGAIDQFHIASTPPLLNVHDQQIFFFAGKMFHQSRVFFSEFFFKKLRNRGGNTEKNNPTR